MKKISFIAIVLSALMLSGCATQSIQQGKDLSSSGIAYTEAVENLLDVTIDQVIDFDTAELKKSRRGSDPRVMIVSKNEGVILLISEINAFRAQTRLLKTYFINLQALADSSVKDDAGSSVLALSDSINKLNKEISGEDGKGLLTSEQKQQIGALGGLVANSINAAQIKRALERDSEVIGIYLCHQENQLNNIAEILQDRFNASNDLFLEEKIIAPYVDKEKKLGASWADNRKLWFKTQFMNQQLYTAQEAAKQLRGVWADILQGKSDLNSLSVLISDVNEFVIAAQVLKEAGDSQ